MNLGLTFQIVDDLLDFTGDAQDARQAGPVRPRRGTGHPAAHPRPEEGRPGRPGPAQSPSSAARTSPPTSGGSCWTPWPRPGPSTTRWDGPGSSPSGRSRRIDPFPDSPPRETLIRLALYGLTRSR
ncbi:MAG: hypothetical protein M0C28_00535 [Candidatus Moduliflexus flocculans]|nr:hypothetical protein [Candidatus Moduliflexus flocculans]